MLTQSLTLEPPHLPLASYHMHAYTHTHTHTHTTEVSLYSHFVPYFEEVSPHSREGGVVPSHHTEVVIRHVPTKWLFPSEDGRIIQVPLCRHTQGVFRLWQCIKLHRPPTYPHSPSETVTIHRAEMQEGCPPHKQLCPGPYNSLKARL